MEEEKPVDPWRDVVFDAAYYAGRYSDAKASCGDDAEALFQHFKTYGIKEGRQASPNFDLTYYLANNPSVQQIIGSSTDYQAAYDYYINTGYLDVAKTAAPANIGDHFYARIQMTPGKNLSLSDNNVILYSASELPAQIWEFIRQADGSYKIVNAKYSLCLSVQDGARTSGANVHTAKDVGGNHQRWFIYEYNNRYMLRPAASAYCALDVYGGYTDDLTNVEIYAANRSIAQMFDICKFDYTGAEYAVDLGQDLYVKINNYASGTYLTNGSTNVTCAPDTNQALSVWRLVHQDDGSYRIIGQNTRMDMMAQDSADGDGVNVNMQYDFDSGTKAQRWYIYRCHHGYTLRAAHSSATRLAVESVSPNANVNVQLGTVAGDDKQIFSITEIDYLDAVAPDDLGSEFYAKVRYYGGGTYMSLSNVNVVTYTHSNANAQVWRFVRQDNGSYKIINQKSGMLLDALDINAVDGTNVRTRTQEFAITSGWYLYKVGGLYALRCADTENLMVTVEGGSSDPETNVHLGTFTGQTAQRFMLEMVDFYDAVEPIDLGDTFYSKITNIHSGKNLCLNSDGGVNVVLKSNSDDASQTWKFVRQSDGSYEIINQGNGFLLNTSGGSSEPGTNVNTRGDENLTQQRWFIYLKEGNYMLRPACAPNCLLTVSDDAYPEGANIQNETAAFTDAQMFSIISDVCGEAAVNAVGVTVEQMTVLRKIMYAVETGGQVYGNADYSDFTEAYTNTSLEHAITIGAGQWYGPEARSLLNRIREADPGLFASLDTAGIAADLDASDWSAYSISKTSAKAKCIVAIISTDLGKEMQDQMIDEQMIRFMQEAKDLGVTDIDALMMCANIRHLGGLSALKRILNKTATPYTLNNIYAAMQSDTGNQVGAPLFKSRHEFVIKYLNMYIPAEPVAAATEHSFGYIKVEKYATCGEAGLTFYLCNNCNYVKKEVTLPTGEHAWIDATCTEPKTCGVCGLTEGTASGHSYTATVTAPTCTEDGYTTYTCTCGDSYVADPVPASGHAYVNGICSACGAADPDYVEPSEPTPVDYYLIGYINGADYGCEADYENLGQYKFVDGKLTATFTSDSYVFVKTGDNAHWYLFEQFCQSTSGTLYENKTEKMFVPGNVELTFTLTENADGSLTLSYEQKTVVPTGTVEPKSATLSLEDEVLINLYFVVEDLDVTAENVGMLIYNEKPETANVATADTVIEGGLYNESNGCYMVSTPGIPGQYLADNLYLVAYAKDEAGNYVYARTVEYSGKKYCTSQMTKGTDALKATCVALMNYGAAAQEYFAATTDYTYDTLMNVEFAQYQYLVNAYDAGMLADRIAVDAAKAGTLGTEKNGFDKRSVSMSADGDFSLNYYFTTDRAVDKVTFYYWSEDQYHAVDTLTLRNASGSKEMVLTDGTNRYWANFAGIAAKDIDKTVFSCGVYEIDGVTYSTGVFSYSIGYYCTSKAAGTDETVKPFAKAIAVYSYYAKAYLNG